MKKIQCKACNSTRVEFKSFTHLILDIPKDSKNKTHTIKSLLENFIFKKENMMLFCE